MTDAVAPVPSKWKSKEIQVIFPTPVREPEVTKPRVRASVPKETPRFEVVNPKFPNEKTKNQSPQYKYAIDLMNEKNQEGVFRNIRDQPVTLKLGELLVTSYDLGRRFQAATRSQRFPIREAKEAHVEIPCNDVSEREEYVDEEEENPTFVSESPAFLVNSGEASPSRASTEELHEMSYQSMMEEEFKRQFVYPVKEVNLARPHEYCAMVTMRLNGRIGEQDYTMLVDSGSELNIMTLHQAQELTLPIDDSGNSWMLKGISGHTMGLKGICWNVPIRIGGMEFSHNFFVMCSNLGNKDMVLGQPWLFSHLTRIDYVHKMGVTLQIWGNGDRKGRSILINLPLVKAPQNVMPVRLHHDYESYSVECTESSEVELGSLGVHPSSMKVPKFPSRVVDALQMGEQKLEKQWPEGLSEDLLLESSFTIPFIAEIMRHAWFALVGSGAETLSECIN